MAAVPVAPLFITAFFAATISVSIMGVYETAIDTILVSFLEDEAENDDKGNITFASGDLATFMKGTKSIADAQEAYVTATMDAKTSKIRANNEAEKHLLDGSKNAASKVNLLHILCCDPSLLPSASLLSLTWLVCCQRKGQRKAKKAAKKGKGQRESEAADQGADEV